MNHRPKIIAFYLPQFHAIPENDQWWGQGFTEWTNVKKAKSLFEGHYQPRIPANKNYYNLMDPGTIEWQINLAKQNNIFGFCYYHYYFEGKKLLEKPLENLLRRKDLDFPFCISWANHNWTRTWDGKEKKILMKQGYGNEKTWHEHFQYLLPFFQDKRYIKINNKPIFIIFWSSQFDKIDEMIELWNHLAKENGFDGMYFIEMLNHNQKKATSNLSSAVIEF